MGPIGFPQTSFTQYQSAMRKIPEGRRSQKLGCMQSLPALEIAASSDSGASLYGAASDSTAWASLCGGATDITAWASLCGAASDSTAWVSLCGTASDFTAWASLCDAASDFTAWASLCGAASDVTALTGLCGGATDITAWASLCGAASDSVVWVSLCCAASDVTAASWLYGASTDVIVEASLCGATSDVTAWSSFCGAAVFTFMSLRHVHVQWVPVTTTWHVLRLRIEERPPIWRVAANKLNKQSWTADKGWSSSLGLGEVLPTPPCKIFMLRNTCRQDASSGDKTIRR